MIDLTPDPNLAMLEIASDALGDLATIRGYQTAESQLDQRGFKHDTSPDAPICRWTLSRHGIRMADEIRRFPRFIGWASAE